MDIHYWHRVSKDYDKEIFDVYATNKDGVLQQYLHKHTNKKHLAIDFGCGIGKAFSILAPGFKSVLAYDISKHCVASSLKMVKENGYKNVTVKKQDLSSKKLALPTCDFAVCVNVVMLPALEKNRAILQNIYKTLKKGGHLVLVVPSFESGIFATQRVIDWYAKDGVKSDEISTSDFKHIPSKKTEVVQGLIRIDNEPTKHYLQVELQSLLSDIGFEVTAFEKLQYPWTTEFAEPPAWMQAPYPWDWMVECRKPLTK